MRFLGGRLLCATLVASILLPAQTTGEIRLAVVDSTGAPIEAQGRLDAIGFVTSRTFQTDPQGKVTMDGLARGRYRLQVTKTGFATEAVIVEVGGEPVLRTVTLPLVSPPSSVTVVGSTPLSGADLLRDEIAAPVQGANSGDVERSGALDFSDFLNRRLNAVYVNEIQGNPYQPDVNYRGYTASPLLGTPQGISIYMDGVRLNQPFGDVVSWDLIPRQAIAEVTLIPGSNPLFGLNTLGGALSIQTKDGRVNPGTLVELSGGGFGRKTAAIEHGGSASNGLNWFGLTNLSFEDGWRRDSPSNVRQFFGRIGRQSDRTAMNLTVAYVNNALTGNGLQEQRFLERDYSSVYTKPDFTGNRSPFVNLSARRSVGRHVSLSGNLYYRYIRTRTLNGDINDDALDQSVYQPSAAERNALTAAGYSGFPTSGENATNTPFPFWRCIGQSLLRDEPAEKCNGLLNRSNSSQRNYGLSGQATWFNAGASNRNQFTAGAAWDRSVVGFNQLTQLGYLNADRSVTGVNSFADGITGGDEDGVPLDTRVDLKGRIHTGSVYATDTLSISRWAHVTLSGRYNRTVVDNRDHIQPQSGPGSLTARHVFDRFNPAAGITLRATNAMNVYFGYSEGNRAPTSIELSCADPNEPCKLPNAIAGDPPLKQVTTRTYEAGVRGGSSERRLSWSLGWFRADNRDDILFVSSETTGFGYFKNFGQTLRQGLEVEARAQIRRVTLGGGYTLLDATFQSEEEVNGTGNSTNEEALRGVKGVDGSISIQPGNRMPLVPRHLFKSWVDMQVTSKISANIGVVAVSGSLARGNENNLHQADGQYYIGPGSSPGYAVTNLGARYGVRRRLQFFVQINNLFDKRYYTGAQLGPTGFTDTGAFVARPFPAITGQFPVRQATFYAPGAPRAAWAGLRVGF